MSADTLIGAIAKRFPIKAVRGDDERIVSHIYVAPDNSQVVWAEPNWLTSFDTHGVHLVEGSLSGNGPWLVGDTQFLEMGEQDKLQYIHTSMVLIEKEQGHDYQKAVQLLAKAF